MPALTRPRARRVPAPSRLPALRAQRALRSDGRAGGGEALRGRPHTHSAQAALILFFWESSRFLGVLQGPWRRRRTRGVSLSAAGPAAGPGR